MACELVVKPRLSPSEGPTTRMHMIMQVMSGTFFCSALALHIQLSPVHIVTFRAADTSSHHGVLIAAAAAEQLHNHLR